MVLAENAPLLTVWLPGLLIVNISNVRSHWAKEMLKTRIHRGQARMLVLHGFGHLQASARAAIQTGLRPGSNGLLVRLTRVFVGQQHDFDDDDNLNISLKHVRDGVADALGFNDGNRLVSFRYSQERSDAGGARVGRSAPSRAEGPASPARGAERPAAPLPLPPPSPGQGRNAGSAGGGTPASPAGGAQGAPGARVQVYERESCERCGSLTTRRNG